MITKDNKTSLWIKCIFAELINKDHNVLFNEVYEYYKDTDITELQELFIGIRFETISAVELVFKIRKGR